MKIDRTRLEQSIEELGRIGATERGGLTRLALSDEDKRGRDLLVALDARGRAAGHRRPDGQHLRRAGRPARAAAR